MDSTTDFLEMASREVEASGLAASKMIGHELIKRQRELKLGELITQLNVQQQQQQPQQ